MTLDGQKRRLYERLILGELDIESYNKEKAPLDAELMRLFHINTVISSELENLARGSRNRKLAEQASAENGLTLALVDLLIERVLIFPGERVEVRWKIAEFFGTDSGDGFKCLAV